MEVIYSDCHVACMCSVLCGIVFIGLTCWFGHVLEFIRLWIWVVTGLMRFLCLFDRKNMWGFRG